MFGKIKDKIYDIIGWGIYKAFGSMLQPEYYIHDPPIEESEFAEEKPRIIDGVCYMTRNEAYELKKKMGEDIKIAKNVVAKAEALYNGKLSGGNCFLFNSGTPSDFLHIRDNDKLDWAAVKRYHPEIVAEGSGREEEEFDETIRQMEKEGNFLNWLKDEEDE
jgi:hypothetical protein